MFPKSTSSTVVREGEKALIGKKTLTTRTAMSGTVYQTRIETDRQTELFQSKGEKLSLHLEIHSVSLRNGELLKQ